MSDTSFVGAVIEIGSQSIHMKIASISAGGIKPLEDVFVDTSLGHDTFFDGSIKLDTMMSMAHNLLAFKNLMESYGVVERRIVGTTAFREAHNAEYVVDQLFRKTGLRVELIENSMERWLSYKAIRDRIADYQKLRDEGTMVVDVGTGSLEVTVFQAGHLVSTFNMLLGSLRLRHILYETERETLFFSSVLEEYLAYSLDRLNSFLPKERMKHFIALSKEACYLAQLHRYDHPAETALVLTVTDLENLYHRVEKAGAANLARELCISKPQAELLLPTITVYRMLLQTTDAKELLLPLVCLRDGLLADMFDKHFGGERQISFLDDMVAAARSLGSRYLYDADHSSFVESVSLLIFDKLSAVHGLLDRQRLLLQLAAITHDIGKFVSFHRHYLHSFYLISASEILGLSQHEKSLVANVARYHSEDLPASSDDNFKSLSIQDRVIVSKLTAILRLADSLDQSHLQKAEGIDVEVGEGKVVIKMASRADTLIEEFTFGRKAMFFAEVFGYIPSLVKQRND